LPKERNVKRIVWMEYKAIYKAYSHAQLVGKVRYRDDEPDEAAAEAQSVREAEDWSEILNLSAKEGFSIKEGGVLHSADNIVFWAFLEKP
jgi:hypothetical protein